MVMRVAAPSIRITPILRWRTFPLFSKLLEHRGWSIWVVAFAAVQLCLVNAGLIGSVCVIRSLTGVPCPGCGLSRAVVHLFRGEWSESIHDHLFAPVFLLGLLILTLVSTFPSKWHRRIVAQIAVWEECTGITTILVGLLLLYWSTRLVLTQV